MSTERGKSPKLDVAVVAGLLVALVGLFAGMPVVSALFTAAMIAFLAYAFVNAPPRYRRFGLSHRDQAVDHYQGQFGKSYPEDPGQSK